MDIKKKHKQADRPQLKKIRMTREKFIGTANSFTKE